MKILSGKEVTNHIYDELKKKREELIIWPGLAIMLIGNRPDSEVYVKMKLKKCEELKINGRVIRYSDDISEETLINEVKIYAKDKSIHGLLIQLPLPPHINTRKVLSHIPLKLDVDAFHYENVANLTLNHTTYFKPCTQLGVFELLKFYNIELKGKHCVIIGSGSIGLPLSLMLLHAGSTISICNKDTVNPKSISIMGDIVFTCCGQAQMVKKDWLQKDAIVIDIGINQIKDSSKKSGHRLVGDVEFDDVKDHVAAITPVPGGIGPLTVAMLMKNTIMNTERHYWN